MRPRWLTLYGIVGRYRIQDDIRRSVRLYWLLLVPHLWTTWDRIRDRNFAGAKRIKNIDVAWGTFTAPMVTSFYNNWEVNIRLFRRAMILPGYPQMSVSAVSLVDQLNGRKIHPIQKFLSCFLRRRTWAVSKRIEMMVWTMQDHAWLTWSAKFPERKSRQTNKSIISFVLTTIKPDEPVS